MNECVLGIVCSLIAFEPHRFEVAVHVPISSRGRLPRYEVITHIESGRIHCGIGGEQK